MVRPDSVAAGLALLVERSDRLGAQTLAVRRLRLDDAPSEALRLERGPTHISAVVALHDDRVRLVLLVGVDRRARPAGRAVLPREVVDGVQRFGLLAGNDDASE